MTEAEVVTVIRRHLERQFPKTCSMCGRVFPSLADYIRRVRHQGKPISYDFALGDWEPEEPIGAAAMANCSCGTTLSLSSAGMARAELSELMRWARAETIRRGIGLSDLLAGIRAKLEAQVLAEHARPAAP